MKLNNCQARDSDPSPVQLSLKLGLQLKLSILIRVNSKFTDSLSLFGYLSKHLPYVGLILQCFY